MNPIGGFFLIIANFISSLLSLYNFCIFIYIVLSWLFAMDMLQRHKPIINGKRFKWGDLSNFLARFIEPLLRRIRKKVPLVGGQLDLSPIVLIIGVAIVDYTIVYIGWKLATLVGGSASPY